MIDHCRLFVAASVLLTACSGVDDKLTSCLCEFDADGITAVCKTQEGKSETLPCELGCSTGYGCVAEGEPQTVMADPPVPGGHEVSIARIPAGSEAISTSVFHFFAGDRPRLLFATEEPRLYSVEPEGKLVWSADLPAPATGGLVATPVDFQENVYVGCGNGNAYAYVEPGEIVWQYDANASILATALVSQEGADPLVALATADGDVLLVTLDGETGPAGFAAPAGPYDGAVLDWAPDERALQVAFLDGSEHTLDYLAYDLEGQALVLDRNFEQVAGFDFYFGHFTVLAEGALWRFGYYRMGGVVHHHDVQVEIPLEGCKAVGSLGSTAVQLVCGDALYVIDDIYSDDQFSSAAFFQDGAALSGNQYQIQNSLMDSWLVSAEQAHFFNAKTHGVLQGLAFTLNLGLSDACFSNLKACAITTAEQGVHYFPGRDGVYRITVASQL